MKYQIECNTTKGLATVQLEERSVEAAALSAIEALAVERLVILPHEVVRIFAQDGIQRKKLKLTKRERARVDWLSKALLDESGPAKRWFTVAGVYEGTSDRYATTVLAASESEALLRAFHDCSEDNDGCPDPLLVLAILEGEHNLLDCKYSQDWYVDYSGPAPDDLNEYLEEAEGQVPLQFTVLSTEGTYHLLAPSALVAEHTVNARRVAGVVAGHVKNLLDEVKPSVTRWAYDEQKSDFLERASVRMSSANAEKTG